MTSQGKLDCAKTCTHDTKGTQKAKHDKRAKARQAIENIDC